MLGDRLAGHHGADLRHRPAGPNARAEWPQQGSGAPGVRTGQDGRSRTVAEGSGKAGYGRIGGIRVLLGTKGTRKTTLIFPREEKKSMGE